MEQSEKIKIAGCDPFHTVVRKFDVKSSTSKLIGVKNDWHINEQWIQEICKESDYELHTVDAMSFGGRAIDVHHINPITGRWMTGSSSGTAINVFLGMNDIGIGTDGGGSVLGPAMSLNLYGFISKCLDEESMNKYSKISTDGIQFSPSLGFITKKFQEMKQIVQDTIHIKETTEHITVYNIGSEIDVYQDRHTLIRKLQPLLEEYDLIVSKEGPVDLEAYGDSIIGHFDSKTKALQRKGSKGILRVVNMLNATALCIPSDELACGSVIMCKSNVEAISKLFTYAKQFDEFQDDLIDRYFRTSNTWTPKGFGGENEI